MQKVNNSINFKVRYLFNEKNYALVKLLCKRFFLIY